jgi:hypothetical protein
LATNEFDLVHVLSVGGVGAWCEQIHGVRRGNATQWRYYRQTTKDVIGARSALQCVAGSVSPVAL